MKEYFLLNGSFIPDPVFNTNRQKVSSDPSSRFKGSRVNCSIVKSRLSSTG